MTDFSQKIPFDDFKKNLLEGPFSQKLPSKLEKIDTIIKQSYILSPYTVRELNDDRGKMLDFVHGLRKLSAHARNFDDIKKRLNRLQKSGRIVIK